MPSSTIAAASLKRPPFLRCASTTRTTRGFDGMARTRRSQRSNGEQLVGGQPLDQREDLAEQEERRLAPTGDDDRVRGRQPEVVAGGSEVPLEARERIGVLGIRGDDALEERRRAPDVAEDAGEKIGRRA